MNKKKGVLDLIHKSIDLMHCPRMVIDAAMKIVNPIRYHKRKRYFKDLKKRFSPSTSIIANNCFGARISQDLGYRYNSPIAGLSIDDADYMIFVQNLHEALVTPLKFGEWFDNKCGTRYPIGILKTSGGIINIRFVHYKSEKDAEKAWIRRCKRVNLDDIVVLQTYAGQDVASMYENLTSLGYTNRIVLFTTHDFECDDSRICYIKEMKGAHEILAYALAHKLYKYLARVEW